MTLFFNYLKNGKAFLTTSGLFLIFSLITSMLINSTANPLFTNIVHYPWLNFIFINITFMGDAFFIILISVFIIFYLQRLRLGLKLLLGLTITMLLIQLLNNEILFDKFSIYTENGQYLFNTQLNKNNPINTIISTHTAVVFTWASILSIKIKQEKWQRLFFVIAVFVAFSRLYLAPHLFFHLLTGAGIGLFSGLLVYVLQTNIMTSLKKSIRLLQLSGADKDSFTELQIR